MKTFVSCKKAQTNYKRLGLAEKSSKKAIQGLIGINNIESVFEDKLVLPVGYNGLANTAHTCFDQHKRLILSPDIIWLNIVQQLAIHVNQNSEQLRSKFVSFNGKKLIKVRRDDFVKGVQNNWQEVFPEFTKQIKTFIGEDNHELIMGNFSTTNEISKAAFEVAMMDVVKSYFDYKFMTKCGIPEITLEGEKSDWENIVNKARRLNKYGLDWWLISLIPVLEEFVNVFDDNINEDYWDSFFKEFSMSGGPYINGHFNKLFAYTFDYEKKIQRNDFDKITTDRFTGGLSSVPFLWYYFDQVHPMQFISGFVGMEQGKDYLKPCIGWAVADRKTSETELREEKERFDIEEQ